MAALALVIVLFVYSTYFAVGASQAQAAVAVQPTCVSLPPVQCDDVTGGEFNTYGGLIRNLESVPASFKVWTYPIPKEMLWNDVNARMFEGPLKDFDAGYRWETLLHHRLSGAVKIPASDTRWRQWTTKDAATATAFYLPMYLAGGLTITDDDPRKNEEGIWEKRHNERADYAMKVLQHAWDNWPYWNRTSGIDHVILAAIDQGLGQMPDPASMPTLLSHLRQAHVMSCLGAYTAPYFYSNRDVVLAPFDTREGLRERSMKDNIPLNDPSDPASARKTLAVFVGKPHPTNTWPPEMPQWGSLRNHIFELYPDDADIKLINTDKVGFLGDYFNFLDSATFCLHLPGYYPARWSSRLAHVLASGCVPVVLIDNLELPYEEYIDWSRAVIRVSEYEAHQPGKLREILKAIPAEVVREKAANVRILARLLGADLENGPDLTKVPRDPDTFDFAMAALEKRMSAWLGSRTAV